MFGYCVDRQYVFLKREFHQFSRYGNICDQLKFCFQGKVVEQTSEGGMSSGPGGATGASVACPCSRPASVMTDSGFNSSLSLRNV